MKKGGHTNSHNDQKPGAEPPKIYNRTSARLNEIIWIRATATDPVGEWRENVSGDDEEREVLFE